MFQKQRYLSPFTLRFLDPKIEEKYLDHYSNPRKMNFYINSLFIILVYLYFTINYIWDQNNLIFLLPLGATIVQLLLLLIGKIKTNNQTIIQLISFALFTYLLIDYFIAKLFSDIQDMNNHQLFVFVGFFSMQVLQLSNENINQWIFRCISMIISTQYFLYHYSYYLWHHVAALSISQLLLMIIYYIREKLMRFQFYQQYNYEQELLGWKKILDQAIPNSIFVIKFQSFDDKQIVFMNNKCLNEFNLLKKDDMIQHLNKFTKEEGDDPEATPYNVQKNTEQSFIQVGENNVQQQSSLINVMKAQMEGKQFNLDCALHSCTTLTPSSNNIHYRFQYQYQFNNLNMVDYFDVQLVQIIWERCPSWMVVLNNITERMQNQQLKSLHCYKDKLLATVTHDLKTPLNGILGLVQASLMNENIQKIKEYLEIVKLNSLLLISLVSDILDYSQISKNKLRLNPTQINIGKVIQDVYELCKIQASEKGLNLQIINQLQDKCLTIYNDGNRIKQVVLNFVSNALKYTEQGSINIILSNDKQNQNNENGRELIKISVQDTGAGIPLNIQEQLFKEFGTFDHYKGSNKSGIGLGLVICKKLAGLLGPEEKIDVESTEGQGSTFNIVIFRQLQREIKNFDNQSKISQQFNQLCSEDEWQVQSPELFSTRDLPHNRELKQIKLLSNLTGALTKDSQMKLSILIVDDSTFNIISLKAMLQQFNFIINEAHNGQQAIDKIQQDSKNLSLIIMDIDMPILDGIKATTQIKALMKKRIVRPCPIIMSTGYDSQEEHIKCKQAGCDNFLQKPILIEKLTEILKHYKLI